MTEIGNVRGTDRQEPERVFTPLALPVRDMFKERTENDLNGRPYLQTTVSDALREVGTQVLLYGDPGVGKTTLLNYCAAHEHLRVLSVGCLSEWTYEQHIDAALRELLLEEEVDRTHEESRSSRSRWGVSKILFFGRDREKTNAQLRRVRAVQRMPLLRLADAMREQGVKVCIFDNFHNVSEDERRSFAQAVEVLSDSARATGNIKMALVGVVYDAASLVATSGSVGRRLVEIGVPRMPDAGITQILLTGFALLGLEVEQRALDRLVFFCDGFPFLAHELGLTISRYVIRDRRALIDETDVEYGLRDTARSVEASYPERFKAAFREDDGRLRRRVIQTLSRTRRNEWSARDIVRRYRVDWLSQEWTDEDQSDVGRVPGAVDELTRGECGQLLIRSGAPGDRRYRFADPYVRVCAQMLDLDGEEPTS